MHYRWQVSKESPMRLDQAVYQEAKQQNWNEIVSRSQIKKYIEGGGVKVNEKVITKAGFTLKSRDWISLHVIDSQHYDIPEYAFPITVIYEDLELLVIDKPAGFSMHPGAGNRDNTLVNALMYYFKNGGRTLPEILEEEGQKKERAEILRPGIVHRLDKDTTGLIVVAKTRKAQVELSKQFALRNAKRTYVALVFSTPRGRRIVNTQDEGVVDAPLGRHLKKRTSMAIREVTGKRAVTHWKVIERMHYGCLLELRLETGRTHQIRVHMNSIGSPVIGDKVYGDSSGLPPLLRKTGDNFGRQALHAASLGFSHPSTGEWMGFNSPTPKDMQALIEEFRGYRGK